MSGIITRSVVWLTLLSAAGCSLLEPAPGAGSRGWSDSLGGGLRDIPRASPPALPAAAAGNSGRPASFWERLRDQRVGQINEHLSVEEPSGW